MKDSQRGGGEDSVNEQGHGPTVAGEGVVCLRCGEPYGYFHGDVGWHVHCTNSLCFYYGGSCEGLGAGESTKECDEDFPL